MTEEDLKISELGAYTNNSMNKEGLKKLVAKVNSGGGTVDAYTKAETDALLATKQGTLTAGDNVAISEENVISATDTKYTAGTGISISEQNVISASGGSNDWTLATSLEEIKETVFGNKKRIVEKDTVFELFESSQMGGFRFYIFVPKGCNANNIVSAKTFTYSNDTQIFLINTSLKVDNGGYFSGFEYKYTRYTVSTTPTIAIDGSYTTSLSLRTTRDDDYSATSNGYRVYYR